MESNNRGRDQKLVNFLKKTKLTPPKLDPPSLPSPSPSLTPTILHQDGPLRGQLSLQGGLLPHNPHMFLPGTRKMRNYNDSHQYKSLDGYSKRGEQEEKRKNRIAVVLQEDEESWREQYGRREVVTSMENKVKEEPFRTTQRKLYQIQFKNSKGREKTKGGVLSYLKIPNLSGYDPSHTSASFGTYYEFESYMNSLIHNSKQESKESLPAPKTKDKRFSIIPALKLSGYKQKKMIEKAEVTPQNLTTLHHYIISKRAEQQKQKDLVIESKKHQLVQNVVMLKSKLQKQRQKRLNRGVDLSPEELVQKEMEEGEDQSRKVQSPSKLSQIKKKGRNIPYFLNSSLDKSVYEQKIASYREFIFMVNLAHRVYDPVTVLESYSLSKQEKNSIARYSYYVGPGNNSMLVRSLMKRRIWWSQTKNMEEAHFVWTQLKMQASFGRQTVCSYSTDLREEEKNEEKKCKEEKSEQALVVKKIKKKDYILEGLFTIDQCRPNRLQPPSPQKSTKSGFPKGLMFRAPFAVWDQQKILTEQDSELYIALMSKIPLSQIEDFEHRLKYLPKDLLRKEPSEDIHVHNHFQCNHSLGNKKALLHHLQLYYSLTGLPQDKAFPPTYHIRQGENDPNFKLFLEQYKRVSREQPQLKNIWILKPGENTNRGTGIVVVKDMRDIRKRLNCKQKHSNGENKTFILQKYIERPLLYRERKFDIRQFMIITGMHGRLRAYFYGEGYVRTSSYLFNLNDIKDHTIHLTNDAVQKECEDYGCFEAGNKVSFNDLQKYFSKTAPGKNFQINQIYPKMRDLAKDAVCSTFVSLDPGRRLHNFEVFGLDFMIDEDLRVHLIEVNTNPCLELSSNLLTRLIPLMLEQAFRLGLDPLFPPPSHYTNNTRHQAPDCSLDKFQFQLIFDQEREGPDLRRLYSSNRESYEEMLKSLAMGEFQTDDIFQDQGQEIEVDKFI